MPTFETPGPITVSVDVGVGNIRVTATDRTDTVVDVAPSDATKKGDVEAAEQTRVDYANGVLTIKAPKAWRQWMPWRGDGSVEVRVEVPAGSRVEGSAAVAALRCSGPIGECRFKTAAGDLDVVDGGPLDLATSSGDVIVGRATGHVAVKTASGSVRVDRIDGSAAVRNVNGDTWLGEVTGELRISGANGRITVDHTGATVVAKNANGDVRLGDVSGDVVAETARGTVDVGVRDGVAAWLDLTTTFGNMRNDLQDAGPPTTNEGAIEVRARTSFGDINIRRAATDRTPPR
ncbi:MAG TPA: DUF4097 family beta strand repeat-containing protein [Acidimicrobiia bacterium]|jgi:DUF4097 and DUF4098 domain-containing protein YvlB